MVDFFLEEGFPGILHSNIPGPVVQFSLEEMFLGFFVRIFLDQW